MECKNCDRPLRSDYSFCSNCGAKIIRNRITLKNLLYDITERYFNVDNTFLKTLWHLLVKPNEVIEGYINGVRKKYINPIGYYTIAITLTGLLFFLIKEFFLDQLSMEWMGTGAPDQGKNTFETTIKYQSIISIISIPIYAILSKLMFFSYKKLNYTEHIIANLYLFAQYTIVSFPIMLIALYLGANYLAITYIGMIFQIIYVAYCFKKIFSLTWGKIIWKTIVFLFLVLFAFILGVILVMIGMYLIGGEEAMKALSNPPQ